MVLNEYYSIKIDMHAFINDKLKFVIQTLTVNSYQILIYWFSEMVFVQNVLHLMLFNCVEKTTHSTNLTSNNLSYPSNKRVVNNEKYAVSLGRS